MSRTRNTALFATALAATTAAVAYDHAANGVPPPAPAAVSAPAAGRVAPCAAAAPRAASPPAPLPSARTERAAPPPPPARLPEGASEAPDLVPDDEM